jgi:hypothetical protein
VRLGIAGDRFVALNITLPPETEARLRERAEAQGEDIASYAARLLRDAVASPSIDDLLSPFRQQVEASGMTDEQLDEFYNDLRAGASRF